MIELYLIRHAQSKMNTIYSAVIGGRSSKTPLTRYGGYQARLLGKSFMQQHINFDVIHCSSAKRAIQTAKLACKEAKFSLENLVISESLTELSQGEWEGRRRSEVYTSNILQEINAGNWNFKAPGGESQKEVEERMLTYLHNHIISSKQYTPGGARLLKHAVFSHGMAIKCLLRGLFDFKPENTYKINLSNASVTQVIISQKKPVLVSINDTSHLKKD